MGTVFKENPPMYLGYTVYEDFVTKKIDAKLYMGDRQKLNIRNVSLSQWYKIMGENFNPNIKSDLEVLDY